MRVDMREKEGKSLGAPDGRLVDILLRCQCPALRRTRSRACRRTLGCRARL